MSTLVAVSVTRGGLMEISRLLKLDGITTGDAREAESALIDAVEAFLMDAPAGEVMAYIDPSLMSMTYGRLLSPGGAVRELGGYGVGVSEVTAGSVSADSSASIVVAYDDELLSDDAIQRLNPDYYNQ